MQVPTITLEDLQAFQKTHFPGPHNALIPPTGPAEAYANDEPDNLGYYPDGVKRTLTDDQVKIFRHSEVHALLRARQLERDDAEYEARRRDSENEAGPELASEAGEPARIDEGKTRIGSQPGLEAQSSASRESKRIDRQPKDSTSESLDYGDHEGSSAEHSHAKTRMQRYSDRKIVSYAD